MHTDEHRPLGRKTAEELKHDITKEREPFDHPMMLQYVH